MNLLIELEQKSTFKRETSKLPWIEKYRPKSLNDIISHKEIIKTLKVCIENKTLTHLLFYGPPGTGKTSTIMACVRELYGSKMPMMVMELNASDDRGIECVREKIKGFVSSRTIYYEKTKMFKLVILDEMDNLTYDAQAGLRKMIEDYTANARFCLICNYSKNIDPALLSRCTTYRFPPLSFDETRTRCIEILKTENIPYTKEGLDIIIKRSGGDMRIVLNSLQVVSMGYKKINTLHINNCLGYPKEEVLNKIFKICIKQNYMTAHKEVKLIKNKCGISLSDLINELNEIIYHQMINRTLPYMKKFTIDQMALMIINLCKIQYYLTDSDTEDMHMAALIGAISIY